MRRDSVINDKGRSAARSGTGAVMGGKRLKAVAVRGKKTIVAAEPERMKILRRNFLKAVGESRDFLTNILRDYGTCGTFVEFITRGDAPIKNWSLNGIAAFPKLMRYAKIMSRNIRLKSSPAMTAR